LTQYQGSKGHSATSDVTGAVPVPINAVTGKREKGGYMSSSTKDGSKKIQQERIAVLVQPGKNYSLQIEMLNWM
jgi:hypothetical protein